MSQRNAHRVRCLKGSDPDGNTFTSLPFSLLVVDDDNDDDERLRVSATGEGNLTPLVCALAQAPNGFRGEIILAEYQMSGKDCRIIQARGY